MGNKESGGQLLTLHRRPVNRSQEMAFGIVQLKVCGQFNSVRWNHSLRPTVRLQRVDSNGYWKSQQREPLTATLQRPKRVLLRSQRRKGLSTPENGGRVVLGTIRTSIQK